MPPHSRRRPQIGPKKKSMAVRNPSSSAVARGGDTKTAIQVHVHSGAQSGSRSGASAGARAKSNPAPARATRKNKTTIKSKTVSNVKKKPAPSAQQLERVRGAVRGVMREQGAQLKKDVRSILRNEAQSLTYKMGREARGTTQWVIKTELARVRARERARKTAQAMQRQVRKATKTKKSASTPTPVHVPVPAPAHTPTPAPTKPSAPAFPEGQFSRIRELPRNVYARAVHSTADIPMEHAVQARNKALGELRFTKFETKQARLRGKLSAQQEKLERLELKKGRAEAGVTYAKSRMWGLRQVWTKFWKGRVERLDKRIARTKARIEGLVKLSANVQARYEQARTEYLRRYPNPAQTARRQLAHARAFMQVNLREQQDRMSRDMGILRSERLPFLELKERNPRVEQQISRIETGIPRIENAGRAIRFEIIYRTMWSEIRRGDYSSALGWLSELEKLTKPNQDDSLTPPFPAPM